MKLMETRENRDTQSANMARNKRGCVKGMRESSSPAPPPSSARKKPGRKSAADKLKEQEVIEVDDDTQDLCSRCVSYVFLNGHLDSGCARSNNKSCGNCARGKKACLDIPKEYDADKDRLLTLYNHYLNMDDEFVRDSFKNSMRDLATVLAQKIEDHKEESPEPEVVPPPPAQSEILMPIMKELLNAVNNLADLDKKKKSVMDRTFLVLNVSPIATVFAWIELKLIRMQHAEHEQQY